MELPIYPEGLPYFRACVKEKSFLYIHENPHYETVRRRVGGKQLLRGVRTECSQLKINANLPNVMKAKAKQANSKVRPTLDGLWFSGVFYRAYERERTGVPLSFDEVLQLRTNGRQRTPQAERRHTWQTVKRYKTTYRAWRFVFRP